MNSDGIEDLDDKMFFYQFYVKVSGLLDDIEHFINNTLISNISTIFQYGCNCPERQGMIRDKHILSLLVWLLLKVFPESETLSKVNHSFIENYAKE